MATLIKVSHNVLGCGFSMFLTDNEPFLSRKLRIKSKQISNSESASKSELIHIFFNDFSGFSFFLKNYRVLPLRIPSKNDISQNTTLLYETSNSSY